MLGNWVKRELEPLSAYAVMDSWLKAEPWPAEYRQQVRQDAELRKALARELYHQVLARLPADGAEREPGRREKRAVQRLTDEMVAHPCLRGSYHRPAAVTHPAEIKIVDRTSSVSTAQDGIGKALSAMMAAAQKRIVIENPYIVMTHDLLNTFKAAGERGVEIWLGTNSPSSTDSADTQAFFLMDWPSILAIVPNLKIFVATGERKLHAKVAIADDRVSLVSTYNLDLLSVEINSEVGALIWSEEFAAQTMQSILADHDEPRNGVREYTILRDAEGRASRADGLPVWGDNGLLLNPPDVTFGPKDHLSEPVLASYRKRMRGWNWLRRNIPHLASVNTFRHRFSPDA